jgi:hypothetical protein
VRDVGTSSNFRVRLALKSQTTPGGSSPLLGDFIDLASRLFAPAVARTPGASAVFRQRFDASGLFINRRRRRKVTDAFWAVPEGNRPMNIIEEFRFNNSKDF